MRVLLWVEVVSKNIAAIYSGFGITLISAAIVEIYYTKVRKVTSLKVAALTLQNS